MKLLDRNGFSLIQVMISIALLGGVSMAFMQVMKTMQQGNTMIKSAGDEQSLDNEIKLILANKIFCRISLAGNMVDDLPTTPVTFQKQNIDQDNEGLNIELWLSDQLGNSRTIKKFSGTDSTKNTYGNIKIKSMKLIMNNGVGFNYSPSEMHTDLGKIKVEVEKNQGSNHDIDKILSFPVSVKMKTNSSRVTTILSCSAQGDVDVTGMLKNCAWERNDFSNAFGAFRTCSVGKKAVSVTCGCGGGNCNSSDDSGTPYSTKPFNLSVPECVCTDSGCSNCNSIGTTCSGTSCNGFKCSYTKQMGVLNMYLFCCEY